MHAVITWDRFILNKNPVDPTALIVHHSCGSALNNTLARIIHEGTDSGSLGGVCALRMVVAV
jgi:hypothetical protein